MIQLYKPGNTNFDYNGDYILHPTICEMVMVLNGTWKLELENPIDGKHKEIVCGAIISAPAPNGTNQLYRIYETIPQDDFVTAYAMPIFMQAAWEVFLMDKRPTKCTGQQALDNLMEGTDYRGKSDITDLATAYYVRKNLIEALQSDEENSFLRRWGGEIYYNNKQVTINKRIGSDKGMRAKFGWNLLGIQQRVDESSVVTRIIPVGYNGRLLPSPSYVDSPRINDYPFVRTRVVKYDDVMLAEDSYDGEGFETIEELQEELVKRAEADFAAGLDLPKIGYIVNIADLAKTEQYKDVADLVRIDLGDTVKCSNKRLGIDTEARCTELRWDCIHHRAVQVKLGEFTSYLSKITSSVNSLNGVIDKATGMVKGERIAGIIDAMQAQLRLQNTAARRTEARAFYMEDLDPTSPLYGAMSIGTQGFQIANERLPDGTDWDWKTFGTAQGFYADVIIGGVLVSQNYIEGEQGFRMDLNTGEIDAAALTTTVKKAVEESTDEKLYNPNGALQQQLTQIIQNAGQVTIEALKGYITEEDLQDVQDALGTQFSVLSDSVNITITGRLNELESEKETLKGELDTVKKVIRATTEGLLIGEEGSTQMLRLDNDIIQLLRDNVPQLFVDENGVTGNQITTKILLIGNLQISAKDSGRIRGKAVR